MGDDRPDGAGAVPKAHSYLMIAPSLSSEALASKVVVSPIEMRRSSPAIGTGGWLTITVSVSVCFAVLVVESSVTASVTV